MKPKMYKDKMKRIVSCLLIAALVFVSITPATAAPVMAASSDAEVDLEWYNFRNNQENNGVTDRATPSNSKEAALKWAQRYGTSYSAAPTPPLLINGKLYIGVGDRVLELEKETGEVIRMSNPMAANVGYAMNPLVYGDGKLFVQVGNGIIQAVDLESLQTVWKTEKIGGQTVSPISYANVNGTGYVYTGTWGGESKDGTFFCVSTDDSNVVDGVKQATWSFTPSTDDAALAETEHLNRGFYWAGAYANENYVAVGSDDGTKEGDYTANAVFYTLHPTTGEIIDRIDNIKGDIRTTAVYDNGYLYFSTKGGHLYKVSVDKDGNLGTASYIDLGGMTTASPVVYKNKIYIGVCGQGGQFDPDGGHGFAVVNNGTETLSADSLLYKIPIKGYPQASALVSTAYAAKDFDGDGIGDGRVYIYFTYNAHPGGIYYTYDTADQTKVAEVSEELYVPAADKQQYCISTICTDYDGTLYYKNDSCHLFAVEKNPAYLNDLAVTADDESEVVWNQPFDSAITEYNLTANATAKTVAIEGIPGDSSADVYYDAEEVVLEEGKTVDTSVIVKTDGKSREYTLHIRQQSNDADLTELLVSKSNTYNASILGMTPAFDADTMEYSVDVTNESQSFYRVWPTGSAHATVEVTGVENVSDIRSATTNGHTRYSVYPEDTSKTAAIDVKVTSEDGSATKTYRVNLVKKYYFASATVETQEYTGNAIEPEITVLNGMGEVVDPSAYTVTYENNTEIGKAVATVTANEDSSYAGSEISTEFDIIAKELGTIQVEEQLYTGSAIEPAITVLSKAGTVVDSSAYDVVYANNTDVGEATVTVTAKENSGYTGSLETTFVIRKETITVTLTNGDIYAYTGGEIKPAIRVKSEGGSNIYANKYTVTYNNNVEVGTATLSVTPLESSGYAGTVSVDYQILKGQLSYYSVEEQAYTGKNLFPEVVVKDNNRKVVPHSAYTISYENNLEVGTASFTVTAKEDSGYFGEISGTFKISKARIAEAEIKDQVYTGSALKPAVKVTDNFGNTVPKSEYTVSYLNNTNAGTAIVVVKAAEDSVYRGTLYTSFAIDHAIIDKVTLSATKYIHDGTAKKPTVYVYADGKRVPSGQYTVAYSNNTKVGTAKVTVTGKNNYTGVIKNTFYIVPKATTKVTAELYGHDDVQVKWNKVTGATGYQVGYKKYTASSYTYKYTTNTSMKIAGLNDGVKYTFRVIPYFKDDSGVKRYSTNAAKSTSVYTLKAVTDVAVTKYSSTKVKVKWSGISGATGYQIYQMSKSNGKYTVVDKCTTTGTSKVISAAKGKIRYYKVRAYKKVTIDGTAKTVYGPWSTIKYRTL